MKQNNLGRHNHQDIAQPFHGIDKEGIKNAHNNQEALERLQKISLSNKRDVKGPSLTTQAQHAIR